MGLLDGNFDLSQLQSALGVSEDEKRAARQQAIMALGLGLMGARKGEEWNRAGLAGLNAMNQYQQTIAGIPEAKLRQVQAAGGLMQLRQQMQAFQDQQDARRATMDFYGGQTPGQPAAPQSPMPQQGMGDRGLGMAPAAPAGAAPAVPGPGPVAPSKQSKFEQYSQLSQFYASRGLITQAQQAADMAEKFRPKVKETRTLTQNGRRVTVNIMDDGSAEVVPFGPDQEKLTFQNVGGKTFGIDPMTGEVNASYENSVSPDAQLSANTTMRGQNMTDARSREQNALAREQGAWTVDMERGVQVNKATGQTRPITSDGQPIGNALDQKRRQAAKTVNDVLDIAEPLIKKSTGTYGGLAYDKALGNVGIATEGAQATAQLRALEGQLMLAQPRMEGPQSDKDTALYKEMAGRISDPTVPRAERLAAVKTIRQLYAKYGATGGGAPSNDPLGIR